jgi:hypothetical protein
MEAVVKSLDPNATTHREAVLDTATEIIGYVVNTYLPFSSSIPSAQTLPRQFPDSGLSHGNAAPGRRFERRRNSHVRPQDRDPAVRARTARQAGYGVQFLAGRETVAVAVARGTRGAGLEGRV